MEDKQPLLTICIPTYRGVDYVIQSLDVIALQINKATIDVELIISDNGTPDSDYGRLKQYVDGIEIPIQLFRHREDIGGRANFEYAASKATGKYLYMLGDDDVISPDLINILTPYLLSEKYSFIHFNTICADANLKCLSLITMDFNRVVCEMSVEEFLKSNQYDATFSSSLVILRDCWLKGDKYVKDVYYGYEWYGRMIWGAVLSGKPCLFYHFPLVIQRNPPKHWEKLRPIFKLIGQGFIWKDLDSRIEGLFQMKLQQRNPKVVKTLSAYYMTRDQHFYQQYEQLFKQVLSDKEYKTVLRYIHTSFPGLLRVVYHIEELVSKVSTRIKNNI
jgi:glycosyltransferase involved in cell wall biosynthesis